MSRLFCACCEVRSERHYSRVDQCRLKLERLSEYSANSLSGSTVCITEVLSEEVIEGRRLSDVEGLVAKVPSKPFV